jgi:hypothetical protein
MTRYTLSLLGLVLALGATTAEAAVRRVPAEYPTISAAVAEAVSGDTIEVGAGRWCGAVITKRLNLVGDGAVIAGSVDGVTCAGPRVQGFLTGFALLTPAASGTTISHFTFDGAGADTDASALGLGVYAQAPNGSKVDAVRVEHNKFVGTVQAITNRGGNDWVIAHNDIQGVTARNGTGGFGIVVAASTSTVRPQRATVRHNRIETAVPTFLKSGKWFPGVYVGSADGTEVAHNQFRLVASNPALMFRGTGVLVTNGTGPGSRSTRVVMNDGSRSDYSVVVMGPTGSNTGGLVLRGNFGTALVEGDESEVTNRSDSNGGASPAAAGREEDRSH